MRGICKRKRGLAVMAALACTMMLTGGCGKNDSGTGNAAPSDSAEAPVQLGQYREPPQIELLAVEEEGNQFALSACSYSWNCQISEEEMEGGVADAPHPLETKSQMVTLAGDGTWAQYRFSIPAAPDEIDIRSWELTDIGNKDAKERVSVDAVYYKEETETQDFIVALESGRVYEFCLEWKQENLAENGFYGTAGYVFRTAVPATADGQEPDGTAGTENAGKGTAADGSLEVLLPEIEIVSFRVTRTDSGESEERGVYSSDLGFQEVMTKYQALDMERDENQHPGEDFVYQMELLDWDGHTLQTIGFEPDDLIIDGVRYSSAGTGTAGELFLAVDELFDEDVPDAVFGEVDTEEPDTVDGLEMTVSYVTPKGISLVFTNNTGKEALFGDDYELQAWEDGAWHEVAYVIDNAAFNAIGYMLTGETPACWKAKWTYCHGILPAGSYRITKSVSVGEGEESVEYTLGAEFSVNNR